MIYLGGGGSEHDEALIWDLAFQPGQRVTIWPFAMPPHRWPGTLEWVKGALLPRGNFPSIALGLESPNFGLDAADIVMIPGGNTFDLLAYLIKHGLLTALREFLQRGGRIYGGSAGAVLMGEDIAIIDAATGGQDENTAQLTDTRGLDVVRGCVTYPHFESNQPSCRIHCESWAINSNVTVLGMPENCGVMIGKDGSAVNAGPAEVFIFKSDGSVTQIQQGQKLPI